MLEQSAGITFFLKTPKNKSNIRYVYLRITIDGIPKETSTKRNWNVNRWDQKAERAIGSKEDVRTLNFFLDSLTSRINQQRTDLMNNGITITAERLMDFVQERPYQKQKSWKNFNRTMMKCWH